jgi:hypothetical protein
VKKLKLNIDAYHLIEIASNEISWIDKGTSAIIEETQHSRNTVGVKSINLT